MDIPDITHLNIHDPGPSKGTSTIPPIPDDITLATDPYLVKLRNYARLIPYSIEPNSRMQEMLELILLRITQCVDAKDYDPGLQQWDSMLT